MRILKGFMRVLLWCDQKCFASFVRPLAVTLVLFPASSGPGCCMEFVAGCHVAERGIDRRHDIPGPPMEHCEAQPL